MHFSFDFIECTTKIVAPVTPQPSLEALEIGFEELLSSIPEQISYCYVPLPAAGHKLPRRELWDCHIQQMASDSSNYAELEALTHESDIINGVYEGGLKTWECSVDLASLLLESHDEAIKFLWESDFRTRLRLSFTFLCYAI